MPKVRIRQHVNPLRRKFQQQINIPDWSEVYAQTHLPLHLDIGCARGEFLLEMAQLRTDLNFLGVEIRHPLVTLANEEKETLGLTNLYYFFGSINYCAEKLLESLPKNTLHFITIQFPDPWFKRKHNKRRVVQPQLVKTLVDYLVEGGTIFLQSDIEDVALEMSRRFAIHPLLTLQHETTWLESNPLPVATERELYVLADDKPVYRVLLKKLSQV